MNYKENCCRTNRKTVGEHLSVDEIVSMIEVPKYANQRGPRFPCIYTCKVLRKAPQAIATEIVEAVSDKHIRTRRGNGTIRELLLRT